MSAPLEKIYAAFDPAPLKKGESDLYIDLDAVRGHSSIVARMRQKILLADKPSCQVLTGHRGSGKSTELWRLRQALETPTADTGRFFVVQVQADDELDRNDIDFPEVLIAIVRQIAQQLRKRARINLKPGYFRDRLQRLKELALSEVSFDGLELGADMAKLSATLRSSPEARQKVRAALEPDTNNWLTAANDIIGQAVLGLREKKLRGLVVIVDDLDKMVTRAHEKAGCSTTEYLFVHRSAQLTAFQCHVVYTLPIELAYSDQEQNIKRLYGGHLPVVPMTKIHAQPPQRGDHDDGMVKFREMITVRLAKAGASNTDLFKSEAVRDDLIRLTGGQPTELMTLIREAIVTEGLPITAKGVQRSRIEAVRSYRRQLRKDHWPLIEEARRTGQIVRTLDNESAFRELLDSRALLLYMNEDEWYGVNPALDGLTAPAPPPSTV